MWLFTVISMNDDHKLTQSERKFIIYDNSLVYVKTRYYIDFGLMIAISALVWIDEMFMIWYNFVKYKKEDKETSDSKPKEEVEKTSDEDPKKIKETGFMPQFIKYYKWTLGVILYWQLGHFNFTKMKT